ncbi:MAG: YdcF family protein [Gammaproteobacteria bacterium]|nr:YdcF family protein [Gammaproteobacteria bacterium]
MDTAFFWASKLFWLVFSPVSLLLWLIVGSWLLSLSRWNRAGQKLLAGTALFSLFLAFVPVGGWMIKPLEQRFPADPVLATKPDGIVLLGGSFSLRLSDNRQQTHLTAHGERLLAFLELARRYPEARLVFTGGSGNPTYQQAREADIAGELFLSLGLNEERLEFERESRNTFENARNTSAMIGPQPGENWLLVTSAFHMPRSMGSFCQQGWKLLPYPTDFQTLEGEPLRISLGFISHLNGLNLALREWIGLLAYRLTGKTNRLIPGPGDDCVQ